MENVLVFAGFVIYFTIIATGIITHVPGRNRKENRVFVRTHDYKLTRQMRKKMR